MTDDIRAEYVLGLGATDSVGFGEIQAVMVRLGDRDRSSADRHGIATVERLIRDQLAMIGSLWQDASGFEQWDLPVDDAMARLEAEVGAAHEPADFLSLPWLALTNRGVELGRARNAERRRLEQGVMKWLGTQQACLLEGDGEPQSVETYRLDDLRREVCCGSAPRFRPRLTDLELQQVLGRLEDFYVTCDARTKMVIEDKVLVNFDGGPVDWLGTNLRNWYLSYEQRLSSFAESDAKG
jgi:hypothetical protein